LFQLPTGVAVDARGDVYVADAAANQIRRITLR
jgi:streptogramin lyase